MLIQRSRWVAATGSALAALLVAGCSSGDADSGGASSSDSTSAAPTSPVAPTSSAAAAQAPTDKLLTAEEAPEGGTVGPVNADVVTTFVNGRTQIRNVADLFGPECGATLKGDFASDHLLTDGVINSVKFPADPPVSVMVTLVPGRIDNFLNRDAFSCSSPPVPSSQITGTNANSTPVNISVAMSTEDAPQVQGVEGLEAFRETRDVVSTNDNGGYMLQRNVILHGFVADTTIDISYTATTEVEGENPITPEGIGYLDDVFVRQVTKLANGGA